MSEPQVTMYDVGYGNVALRIKRSVWMPGADSENPRVARLRIDVTEATPPMPKEVFIWDRNTNYMGGAAEKRDRPMCVAKPGDLATYPVDEPLKKAGVQPFYRSAVFDGVFNSVHDFLLTWDDILFDLNKLVEYVVKLRLIDVNVTP